MPSSIKFPYKVSHLRLTKPVTLLVVELFEKGSRVTQCLEEVQRDELANHKAIKFDTSGVVLHYSNT